ncbi:hypothetical protein K435DRAFT_865298 [Dendrothele bispora CBS 962.96]|uniref:Uncharacterized protein n=1 Tax=Dendrothele bispora (strain CBS 962.96) TaxID=1314807 RepID=A0A4S8LJX3_DENBC|nr:hypothetical protein K435DRAFT_865298 [Dendrothele bispora CBS 962.96]
MAPKKSSNSQPIENNSDLSAQQIYEISIGSKLSGITERLEDATREIQDSRTRKKVEAATKNSRRQAYAASHMAEAASTTKVLMKNYHKLRAKCDVNKAKSHLRDTPTQISSLFDGDQLDVAQRDSEALPQNLFHGSSSEQSADNDTVARDSHVDQGSHSPWLAITPHILKVQSTLELVKIG